MKSEWNGLESREFVGYISNNMENVIRRFYRICLGFYLIKFVISETAYRKGRKLKRELKLVR